MRVVMNGTEVTRDFRLRARNVPRARRALLRNLATQVERGATRLASGQGAPGNYPIPIRTGFLRRGFGFEVRADHAVVFNTAGYARALHQGYRPYGNRNATPIPGRPFFDDAITQVDTDAAHAAWEAALT